MSDYKRVTSPIAIRDAIDLAWANIISEDGYPLNEDPENRFLLNDIYYVPGADAKFIFRQHKKDETIYFWAVAEVSKSYRINYEFNFPMLLTKNANRLYGRVLESDKGFHLAHVGRLGGGPTGVSSKEFRRLAADRGIHPVNVGEESLFIVSDIHAQRVASDLLRFSDLCRFVRSRAASAGLTADQIKPRSEAKSVGQLEGGKRVEVDFEARHAPIVNCLVSFLAQFNWFPTDRRTNGIPDLVVERESFFEPVKRTVLFEIKSASDIHSLICAVGQCKVYDLEYKSDRVIIIALIDENGKRPESWIFRAIRELGIEFIPARRLSDKDFEFEFDSDDELRCFD